MGTKERIRLNLRRFRREAGLSQPQLATLMDTRANTIAQWESGRRSPDTSHLVALANVLERSMDDFLKESPPPAKKREIPAVAAKIIRNDLTDDEREEIAKWQDSFNRRVLDRVLDEKRKSKAK
jgi:transcriptional regulator with XRE-family HTH domain